MIRKRVFKGILLAILLLPVFMFVSWLLTEKKPLDILIVDKTVLSTRGQEHESLFWVLNYRKIVKSDRSLYRSTNDYYGFFPKKDKLYEIHDLMSYNPSEIDSLSGKYDAAYYTDTYGLYYNEWYLDTLQTEQSDKVYGGMDEHDFQFLKGMKDKGKLIIMEFNTLAHPTPEKIRTKTEELFHIRWSGWTLRYLPLMDTMMNQEVPQWVIKGYLLQHNNKWPFKKSGIVFVHESGQLFILENETHLHLDVPQMRSTSYAVTRYSIPATFSYPYWIDITFPADTTNRVVADFYLLANHLGDSILKHYGVPKIFPAIQEHLGYYRFYYFSGDFSDNVVSKTSQFFQGILPANKAFNDPNDLENRSVFFYNVYFPVVNTIFTSYYDWLKSRKGPDAKREN